MCGPVVSKPKARRDELERFAQFYNDKDKFDKLGKMIQFGIRMFVDIVSKEMAADLDATWRFILDARKVAWMFKWVQEAQTVRTAARSSGDSITVALRTGQRFGLMVRWIFENLHIMVKLAPKQKLNVFSVKDPMTLNRMAKTTWFGALICGLLLDLKAEKAAQSDENKEQRKLRRMRIFQQVCDAQICINVMRIPQKVTLALIGKEKAYMESFVGLSGFIAAAFQCYFLYPALPAPKND
jgi:hypothetical protein